MANQDITVDVSDQGNKISVEEDQVSVILSPESGVTINTDEITVNTTEEPVTVTLTKESEVTVSTNDTAGLRGRPGLVWRGNFDGSKNYYQGDSVSYNGSSYIATAYTTASATTPDNSSTFNLIAEKGSDGPQVALLSTPPSSPAGGDVYLDDGTNTSTGIANFRQWTGTEWTDIGGLDMIQYSKKVDFVDASDLIYIGEALPGTATSSATWRIKRINTNAGTDNDIEIKYADGDSNFNNIWDDHLSLTYS